MVQGTYRNCCLIIWMLAFSTFSLSPLSAAPPIVKVVLWGHKLHSHTHSYIHERFFRTFQYMGYPTYWFDDSDDISNFDFSHSLFITEGQVDRNIPIRFDCQYILHNCPDEKYRQLFEASICIEMQKYTDEVLTTPNLKKIAPCIYYDVAGKRVYFPWASDFLPYEIEKMKKLVGKKIKENTIYWIGTIGGKLYGNEDQINEFKRACDENNIEFKHLDPWSKGRSRAECTRMLTSAYLSPAIVGKWQQENGYIPCRIFINICCGQMGVTNSYRVYELFEKKIVYNPDCYQLFYAAKKREAAWTLENQHELMDFIKENHTYINRIKTLLEFMSLTNKQRQPKYARNSHPQEANGIVGKMEVAFNFLAH